VIGERRRGSHLENLRWAFEVSKRGGSDESVDLHAKRIVGGDRRFRGVGGRDARKI
jgi:hypothetical protein